MKKIIALLLSVLMLVSLAACGANPGPSKSGTDEPPVGPSAPTVDEITVGYTSMRSGVMAAYGALIDYCVDLAKADFEERTGIKVNLVIEDAGSSIESAIDATIRLVDDDVPSIIGIAGSTQYSGMLEELEGTDIVMCTTVAPDEIFTRGYDWLFSSYVTRQQENAPMLTWAESIGAKSVAVMLGTDDDSRSLMEYFVEAGEKNGITIYQEWINPTDNDFTANITSARSKNPDAYFILSADTVMSKIIRQMKQLGVTQPINTGGAMGVQSFVDLMEPEELEGLYGQASILPPYIIDDPRVIDYVARYTEGTGYPADITTLVYYDCAMLMFEATAGANGVKEDIPAYLRNQMQGYQGLTGVFNFDERGLGRWEAYMIQAGADKAINLVSTVEIPK